MTGGGIHATSSLVFMDHVYDEGNVMSVQFVENNAEQGGRTTKLQHSINTGPAPPIRQAVRRLPPPRRKEVQELLTSMLKSEVVQPSSSPWASPIVLVKKKDNSFRFCVDYVCKYLTLGNMHCSTVLCVILC